MFSAESNTDIQAVLVSDIGISDLVTFTAQGALAALVNLTDASLVMLILSWPLAIASLLLACVLNIANARYTAKRREFARLRQRQVAEMLKAVGEDLSLPGVILGRTFGRVRMRCCLAVGWSGEWISQSTWNRAWPCGRLRAGSSGPRTNGKPPLRWRHSP